VDIAHRTFGCLALRNALHPALCTPHCRGTHARAEFLQNTPQEISQFEHLAVTDVPQQLLRRLTWLIGKWKRARLHYRGGFLDAGCCHCR